MERKHTPKYRRQKRPDRGDTAFVEFNGRRHYLGDYGSEESRVTYDGLIAEWRARDGRPDVPKHEVTIAEVVAAFWPHVEQFYRRPDGTLTNEVDCFRQALKPITELYASLRAIDFGPKALKVARDRMIERGWKRKTVNKQSVASS